LSSEKQSDSKLAYDKCFSGAARIKWRSWCLAFRDDTFPSPLGVYKFHRGKAFFLFILREISFSNSFVAIQGQCISKPILHKSLLINASPEKDSLAGLFAPFMPWSDNSVLEKKGKFLLTLSAPNAGAPCQIVRTLRQTGQIYPNRVEAIFLIFLCALPLLSFT